MKPLMRAALAGLATGARSTNALAACANTAPGPGELDRRLHTGRAPRLTLVAAAGEFVGDKLAAAPPRTQPPSLVFRAAMGAVTGSVVATRSDEPAAAGAAVGLVVSVLWTFAAPKLRASAARRFGRDLPGSLAEDALAAVCAVAAARG